MSEIIVSIITPVYNGELYLQECVHSVQKQSLKEIEMLIVDDGSEDSSVELVQRMANEDERIHLLKQEHLGAGEARNYAMSEAKGKYLIFLDADDFLYDIDALEKMVSACETCGVNACGSRIVVLENGKIREHSLFREVEFEKNSVMLSDFKEYGNDYFFQAFLFKRDILIKNGVKFPSYKRYQDAVFMAKALSVIDKFAIVPSTLYCYRYGHQDFKLIDQRIKYVLMGIRDNLKLATEVKNEKLARLLVEERINKEYYESIMRNMDEQVLKLILEIKKISYDFLPGLKLSPLERPCGYYELRESHELYAAIVRTYQIEQGFDDLFRKQKIDRVIVYGLGKFGRILLNILEKVQIEVVCCIDANVKEYKEYTIFPDIKNCPHNVPIIVSVLKGEEIVENLRRQGMEEVILWKEMVENYG